VVFMGLEDRVRNCFKAEKRIMYARLGGGSQPEGIQDVYMYLARKFKIPVRLVKEIVSPKPYFGGYE
jgi:hypothetical protein